MSRVYIGDQEFTIIQEWRRRGVFSTRHSNTSSSLQSIINTSKHAIVYTTSHGALNFERNTVIELFKCPPPVSVRLQFEPQWEFNFDNYQAKLDFHWWAVSGVDARWARAEHQQPGNSPIWDNSRVKITFVFPIHTFPAPTSIAINLPASLHTQLPENVLYDQSNNKL